MRARAVSSCSHHLARFSLTRRCAPAFYRFVIWPRLVKLLHRAIPSAYVEKIILPRSTIGSAQEPLTFRSYAPAGWLLYCRVSVDAVLNAFPTLLCTIPATDRSGHALRVWHRLAVCWHHLHSDASQLCLVAFEARVFVRRGSWGGDGIGHVGPDVRRGCCLVGNMG